jgi:hypothetical protein
MSENQQIMILSPTPSAVATDLPGVDGAGKEAAITIPPVVAAVPARVIRCSSLPRILECHASAVPPRVHLDTSSPMAAVGTAAHVNLAQLARGDEVTPPDDDEVAMLVALGRNMWGEVSAWYPADATEVLAEREILPGVVLHGTADVVSREGVSVADWKTGQNKVDHRAQLLGYAWLQFHCTDLSDRTILAQELWVRLGDVTTYRFSRSDLDELPVRLADALAHPYRYSPGMDTCRYCPRYDECPARAEALRGACTAMEPLRDGLPATRETLGALWDRSKMLRSALYRYEGMVEAELERGPLPLGGGKSLVLYDQEEDLIIPSAALSVLGLTAAEQDEAISLTKIGIDRVVKARAEKGKGAAAMRSMMGALREADAIATKIKRIKKVVSDEETNTNTKAGGQP